MTQNVYFFGLRGLPAAHGGFETLVEALAPYLSQNSWNVTVFCQPHDKQYYIQIFSYKGARCIQ